MTNPGSNLRRVRKAYEQVADQIRDQIVSGSLVPGTRLPRELELAETMGVSRSTIREALRVLTSENLIRTAKGATGGSFVMKPSVDYVSDFLISNINLLTASNEITLNDLLEVRAQFEVAAARLAAQRIEPEQLEALRATIPDETDALGWQREFTLNSSFHTQLLRSSGNLLLEVSAQPIFVVLQSRLARATLSEDDHRIIHEGHEVLIELIAAGDVDGVEKAMGAHLDELRVIYERIWQPTAPDPSRLG
jgi:DNA-binding FadR family transcriptional regulator